MNIKKRLIKRLQEVEELAAKKEKEFEAGVYNCMTEEELLEIAYGSPSEKRVAEIWERASKEYKQNKDKLKKFSEWKPAQRNDIKITEGR